MKRAFPVLTTKLLVCSTHSFVCLVLWFHKKSMTMDNSQSALLLRNVVGFMMTLSKKLWRAVLCCPASCTLTSSSSSTNDLIRGKLNFKFSFVPFINYGKGLEFKCFLISAFGKCFLRCLLLLLLAERRKKPRRRRKRTESTKIIKRITFFIVKKSE